MTKDFIEDAIDTLDKGGARYILLAWNDDATPSIRASNVPSQVQLDWARGRLALFLRDIEQTYTK